MLTCVYNTVGAMRVVEEYEAESLRKSGVWFDTPALAKEGKARIEDDSRAEKKQPKKLKEQSNER